MNEKKKCPFCAEMIDADSRQCPCCGEAVPLPPPPKTADPPPRRLIPVREVEPIRLDNPVFRWCRRAVFSLDNDIFNHNGCEGENYQPTRYALVLPYFGGIAAASYIFFGSFGDVKQDVLVENILGAWLPILLLANAVLTCRNIFVLHGWVKKIVYPIFITLAGAIFFVAVTFICSWLYVFVIIILGIWVFLIGTKESLSSDKSNDNSVQEAYIYNNGSVMPTKLTRSDSIGDWHGDDGHTYTEDMSGNLHRK